MDDQAKGIEDKGAETKDDFAKRLGSGIMSAVANSLVDRAIDGISAFCILMDRIHIKTIAEAFEQGVAERPDDSPDKKSAGHLATLMRLTATFCADVKALREQGIRDLAEELAAEATKAQAEKDAEAAKASFGEGQPEAS